MIDRSFSGAVLLAPPMIPSTLWTDAANTSLSTRASNVG